MTENNTQSSDSSSSSHSQKFIVVEGPIGVGKTTLATKLAQSLSAKTVLEDAWSNPFLERFYLNPEEAALPTQLFFLFQRHKQMQELLQSDMFAPDLVTDYLIDKDCLFAKETLSADEYDLYQQAYQHLSIQRPTPNLVIYLQAPVKVLLKRVKQRGRKEEIPIQSNYLQRINDAYTQFFHYYRDSPLLIVNASGIDLVNNEQHYQQLLDKIDQIQGGRNYFNPSVI